MRFGTKLFCIKSTILCFAYRVFLRRWVRIRGQNCKIQNGGSNMAVKILIFCKSNSILPVGFFWALSPNLRSKLKNSKWRIQYGGQNFSFLQIKQYLAYRGFLGHWVRIRGQNCKIQNGGSNMAAKILIFCKSNSI